MASETQPRIESATPSEDDGLQSVSMPVHAGRPPAHGARKDVLERDIAVTWRPEGERRLRGRGHGGQKMLVFRAAYPMRYSSNAQACLKMRSGPSVSSGGTVGRVGDANETSP